MRFYTDGLIPTEDVSLFRRIRSAVIALPDIPDMSCHILARAVTITFDILCIDGCYLGRYLTDAYPHSWNVLPGGNIVDCYPMGVFGGPILLETQGMSPQRLLYAADEDIAKREIALIKQYTRPVFGQLVAKTARALTSILQCNVPLM